MPVDLLVSWNDGAAKRHRGFRRSDNQKGLAAEYTDLISGFARAIADAKCPEIAGPGLNVRFPYRHEECHGCSMC
jgi:hypothetical protein